jgi:hypothetical protein
MDSTLYEKARSPFIYHASAPAVHLEDAAAGLRRTACMPRLVEGTVSASWAIAKVEIIWRVSMEAHCSGLVYLLPSSPSPSVLMLRMQIALVCMVTLQTLLQTTYDNQYHQNSFAAWRELLFPTDFPVHYKGGSYTSYLYSIHDMQTFLNSIIRRYDGLEERSIDIVSTYGMRRPSSAIRRLMRSRLA